MTLRLLLWLIALAIVAATAVHLYRSQGGRPGHR
jgi:hypothetical protein